MDVEEGKASVQSTKLKESYGYKIYKLPRIHVQCALFFMGYYYGAPMCDVPVHYGCQARIVAESYVASLALYVFFWRPDFPGGGVARPDGPSSSQGGACFYDAFALGPSRLVVRMACPILHTLLVLVLPLSRCRKYYLLFHHLLLLILPLLRPPLLLIL